MNVLLKIVQGPNAGAEIILAEGMTVSLGKGDSCDILLADMSLADVACELEVNENRVRMLLPGGAEERLEPFRVKFLGETTAIVIGPETGAWEDIVWPSRSTAASETEDEAQDAPPSQASSATDTDTAPVKKGKSCGCGCMAVLLFLLPVVAVALIFLLWPFRSQVSGVLGSATVDKVRPVVRVVHDAGLAAYRFVFDSVKGFAATQAKEDSAPRCPCIGDVVAEYGLSCVETNGTCVLSGNFLSRARRLSATAAAYAAQPGVSLDFSDDESLRSATAEVLELVGEGRLEVYCATNRIVELSGFSPGASCLKAVLEAIRADIPNVRNIDCSRVRLGEIGEVVQAKDESPKSAVSGIKTARVRREKAKSSAPKMPVVGVVTLPYPCIVLKDGSRVTEGAEFGGFTIDKIGADTIRIKGPEGVFEWRP